MKILVAITKYPINFCKIVLTHYLYVRSQLRYVPLLDGHCCKRGENFVMNYTTRTARLKATAHKELPLWLAEKLMHKNIHGT